MYTITKWKALYINNHHHMTYNLPASNLFTLPQILPNFFRISVIALPKQQHGNMLSTNVQIMNCTHMSHGNELSLSEKLFPMKL